MECLTLQRILRVLRLDTRVILRNDPVQVILHAIRRERDECFPGISILRTGLAPDPPQPLRHPWICVAIARQRQGRGWIHQQRFFRTAGQADRVTAPVRIGNEVADRNRGTGLRAPRVVPAAGGRKDARDLRQVDVPNTESADMHAVLAVSIIHAQRARDRNRQITVPGDGNIRNAESDGTVVRGEIVAERAFDAHRRYLGCQIDALDRLFMQTERRIGLEGMHLRRLQQRGQQYAGVSKSKEEREAGSERHCKSP